MNLKNLCNASFSFLVFTSCSKLIVQSAANKITDGSQSIGLTNTIFEKSTPLKAEESYVLEMNQKESTDYDITLAQNAPVIEQPPVQRVDPLVVQLLVASKLILSSPNTGVIFDIFGDNFLSGQNRVSWLTNTNFGFLALPKNGDEIHGVQDLFGDRTIGPDRKPASHGFEALSKYDGYLSQGGISIAEKNGVINKNDEVFSKLRIWTDRNRDGYSNSSELNSLDYYGISSIDLNYDSTYSERDEFQNIISFKSSAQKKNGQALQVFNLWLSYISAD